MTEQQSERQPFENANDGGQQSSISLRLEIMHMWGCCVGAPATTNLRTCAKKKVLQSKESTISNEGDEDPNQRILSLPVSFRTVADVFLENQDVLLKEFASDPGIPFHIKVLTEYRQQYAQGFLDEEQIVVFRDDNVESELVYGIMVNHFHKRITLFFRGSVSAMDYKIDFKFSLRKLRNAQGEKVHVHKGFSTYLLDKQYNNNNEGNGGNDESKMDEIVRELNKLCQQYPDYRIYVTGHSLGGSLALVAAFHLAPMLTQTSSQQSTTNQSTNDGGGGIGIETPRPITCITFGPMQVGDLRFRRAFTRMEKEGLLNNINILNDGDLIPLYPVWTGLGWYRHAGTKLKLANNTPNTADGGGKQKKCTISRAPDETHSWLAVVWCFDVPNLFKYTGRLFYILCCKKKFWLNHTVTETSVNLEAAQSYLDRMTWEDIYKNCRPQSLRHSMQVGGSGGGKSGKAADVKTKDAGFKSEYLSTFLLVEKK